MHSIRVSCAHRVLYHSGIRYWRVDTLDTLIERCPIDHWHLVAALDQGIVCPQGPIPFWHRVLESGLTRYPDRALRQRSLKLGRCTRSGYRVYTQDTLIERCTSDLWILVAALDQVILCPQYPISQWHKILKSVHTIPWSRAAPAIFET